VTCARVTRNLPGYTEGMLARDDHARVREHLTRCAECADMLGRYELLQACIRGVEPVAPPADLAVRIQVAAARLRAQPSLAQRMYARCWLFFRNILQPLAVPATGGLLSAVLTFVLVTQSLVVGDPFGVVAHDLPLNFIQPARVESLAPFPVSDFTLEQTTGRVRVVVVEADVNARGDVLSYRILSGPDTPALHKQLDQVLMFSTFTPQMSFGRPTSGGRVLLSFSEVRVKG
jgi:anti-sigma factor RsiW